MPKGAYTAPQTVRAHYLSPATIGTTELNRGARLTSRHSCTDPHKSWPSLLRAKTNERSNNLGRDGRTRPCPAVGIDDGGLDVHGLHGTLLRLVGARGPWHLRQHIERYLDDGEAHGAQRLDGVDGYQQDAGAARARELQVLGRVHGAAALAAAADRVEGVRKDLPAPNTDKLSVQAVHLTHVTPTVKEGRKKRKWKLEISTVAERCFSSENPDMVGP